MIPELKKLAYDMYLSNIDLQRGDLDMLRGVRQDDYGMFRDGVLDYYTNRDFAYGQHQDDVNNWYADRDFEYGSYRDGIADDQFVAQNLYGQRQDSIANQRAAEQLALQRAAEQRQQNAFEREAAWRSEDNAIENAGLDSNFESDIVAVAASLGITNSQAKALRDSGSKAWSQALNELGIGEKEKTIEVPDFKENQQEVVEYLKDMDLLDYASGIMPKNTWDMRKMVYDSHGLGTSEVADYDSYEEYLEDYVRYAVESSGMDTDKAGYSYIYR